MIILSTCIRFRWDCGNCSKSVILRTVHFVLRENRGLQPPRLMTREADTMSWQREEFRQFSGRMDGNSDNCREGDWRTTNEVASGSSGVCRLRIDCHSCMLVETGKKANYLGLPCESCGRPPRSPYPLHSTPTKTNKKKEKFFPMVKKHIKSFMKVSKKKDFENVGKEDQSQDELYEKTNDENSS